MSFVQTRFLHTDAFRLSAIYAGVFALSVLILGGIVILITGQVFRDQVVQFSRADIAAIQSGYKSEGILEAREVIGQRMAAPAASDFFLLQRDHTRLAGNLSVMVPRTGTVMVPGGAHDVLGTGTFLAPGLYAFAGSDMFRVHAAQNQIVQTLAWLFAGALLLAVLGGALVSRTFLRRSDAMARACRAIMDGNLKTRVPVRGTQDEMDRLAGTINEMLDRIAALMENLGQVTNDIAHDLRTPVSHLRQALERARSDGGDTEKYVAALDAGIRKTDEILALFAALLRIAQIEGGARRAAFQRFELEPVLEQLRDIFSAVADAEDHRLTLASDGQGVIRGDRALVIQLLSNLIENAILHTPPGTQIALSLVRRDETVVVTVSDNGPGVPPAEHAKLFRRFYRREASRARPGYGLGLAMVAAIAELHGADIKVADESPGLAISITFAAA